MNTDPNASARRRRIAFVIEALTVGGAEQMLVAMANRFIDRGWQVQVICLTVAGELSARLHADIELLVLNKKPGPDLQMARKLRRTITEFNPVAINSHLWTGNLWLRVALPFSKRRIIVTEHSRDSWKPTHYRVIDRILALWTNTLVAVSNDTANFYTEEIGISEKRVRVINNGIDTALFSAGDGATLRQLWAPPGGVLFGTVGRLVAAKNHIRLLDAVEILRESLDNFRVVIVGSGEKYDEIDAAIDARDLSHHVLLTGTRSDIPDVLAALDIFVMSSDREGHPLTALEAQAAGTPVILTDAGGSRDAIAIDGDQRGGLMVPQSAEALAEAMLTLAQDSVLRQDMARVAREVALARFGVDHMVDQYTQVITGTDSSAS